MRKFIKIAPTNNLNHNMTILILKYHMWLWLAMKICFGKICQPKWACKEYLGVNATITSCEPIENFEHVFTDELIGYTVCYTNLFVEQLLPYKSKSQILT